MNEKDKLEKYLLGVSSVTKKYFSENTKKSYLRFYDKLTDYLEKEICESSQIKIIQASEEEKNNNSKQGILNIGIIMRNLERLDVKDLEKQRDKNKESIIGDVKKSNVDIDLPSYEDIEDYINYLYENNKWTDYIINYLLFYYQVRNLDVNFKIITKLKDAIDKETNYMWISASKVVWIRRVYKTANTYGQKKITILDKKLLTALRRVEKRGDVFIPNEEGLGYYIKKSTFKGIGEGKYIKIVIDHFRGNLQKIKEISENRGTSVDILLSNYDIALQ
jgi:hypothetical protein